MLSNIIQKDQNSRCIYEQTKFLKINSDINKIMDLKKSAVSSDTHLRVLSFAFYDLSNHLSLKKILIFAYKILLRFL